MRAGLVLLRSREVNCFPGQDGGCIMGAQF
jgi:hypothetical protein